jgi:hypothetical protein
MPAATSHTARSVMRNVASTTNSLPSGVDLKGRLGPRLFTCGHLPPSHAGACSKRDRRPPSTTATLAPPEARQQETRPNEHQHSSHHHRRRDPPRRRRILPRPVEILGTIEHIFAAPPQSSSWVCASEQTRGERTDSLLACHRPFVPHLLLSIDRCTPFEQHVPDPRRSHCSVTERGGS